MPSLAPAALLALLVAFMEHSAFSDPIFASKGLARERYEDNDKFWSHIGQGWDETALLTSINGRQRMNSRVTGWRAWKWNGSNSAISVDWPSSLRLQAVSCASQFSLFNWRMIRLLPSWRSSTLFRGCVRFATFLRALPALAAPSLVFYGTFVIFSTRFSLRKI